MAKLALSEDDSSQHDDSDDVEFGRKSAARGGLKSKGKKKKTPKKSTPKKAAAPMAQEASTNEIQIRSEKILGVRYGDIKVSDVVKKDFWEKADAREAEATAKHEAANAADQAKLTQLRAQLQQMGGRHPDMQKSIASIESQVAKRARELQLLRDRTDRQWDKIKMETRLQLPLAKRRDIVRATNKSGIGVMGV